jgi:hypothetical protein
MQHNQAVEQAKHSTDTDQPYYNLTLPLYTPYLVNASLLNVSPAWDSYTKNWNNFQHKLLQTYDSFDDPTNFKALCGGKSLKV